MTNLVSLCPDCSTPILRRRKRCGRCRASLPSAPEALAPRDFVLAALAMGPQDEYEAAELLFHLRWGDAWACPCGHRNCTHLRTRPRNFECNGCGRTFSVTNGTGLRRCRVPLVKVVKAAALLALPDTSMSSRELARRLEVSVETAWTLSQRLRSGFLDFQHRELQAPVLLSMCGFRRRPPPRQRRRRDVSPIVPFTVLWDRDLTLVGRTGALDPSSLRRFVDERADVEKPTLLPGCWREDPRHTGNGTHHGVSERWLSVYVAAILGWHNVWAAGGDAHVVTLRLAVTNARFPFARLRPRCPPRQQADWQVSPEAAAGLLAELGLVR